MVKSIKEMRDYALTILDKYRGAVNLNKPTLIQMQHDIDAIFTELRRNGIYIYDDYAGYLTGVSVGTAGKEPTFRLEYRG